MLYMTILANLYARPGLCGAAGVSLADQSASYSWPFLQSYVEPLPVCSPQPPSSRVPDVHTMSTIFTLFIMTSTNEVTFLFPYNCLLAGVLFSALTLMVEFAGKISGL